MYLHTAGYLRRCSIWEDDTMRRWFLPFAGLWLVLWLCVQGCFITPLPCNPFDPRFNPQGCPCQSAADCPGGTACRDGRCGASVISQDGHLRPDGAAPDVRSADAPLPTERSRPPEPSGATPGRVCRRTGPTRADRARQASMSAREHRIRARASPAPDATYRSRSRSGTRWGASRGRPDERFEKTRGSRRRPVGPG